MHQVLWNRPIELGLNGGDIFMVKGPSDALTCLAGQWPRRGPYYVAARSACRAAIAGRRTPDEARRLFIFAVEEAHLTAH
ncbi:hypothetical protein AU381_16080 [Sinorhizobium glycinis]|uniref:DUF982 domain-containing protein n=1 Tax=Sinorhizobium glycinis TaxID=1472378 RepID=A0A178Y5K2_9HYPH|nr:DUF982 domain-containing protein [Sinorhizobium glycinis]OAP42686.1 hypothetical protein AU381_16080 [Sinorhizobium glycinis]